MKIDNQALRLEHLMKIHQHTLTYELSFPPLFVKRNALKKLERGDLLLLGLKRMEMLLLSEDNRCAKVVLSSCGNKSIQIRIVSPLEKRGKEERHKKYREIKLSLGRVQSKVVKAGHTIETKEIDLEKIVLFVEEKPVAVGRLVEVRDRIALEIREVK